MIRLHHLNNSKSQRILWLLEELGLAYDIVFYKREPTLQAPAAMRAVHMLGKAPIVEVDGHVMAESGAVVEYLIHRHGAGRLAPAPTSPDYAHYLEMLQYPEGSANTPLFLGLIVRAMGLAQTPLAAYAQDQLALHLAYMNKLLEGRDYLLGSAFTGADIQLSFILLMAEAQGVLAGEPRLQAYVDRLRARPAFMRAIEKGGPFDLRFG